jgi:AhpD family alkylhydroperoxidase
MPDTCLMHRVPPEQMTPEIRAAREGALALTGDATIIEVFANSPTVTSFFFGDFYRTVFFGGEVERRYKELLRLRLSKTHGCWFCNRNNEAGAREVGYDDAQIAALGGDANAATFTPADRAVIDLADQLALTNMGGALTPDLHRRLKARFSDSQIVELGMVGAILGGLNKFAFVFDLVQREAYCPFVPQEAA